MPEKNFESTQGESEKPKNENLAEKSADPESLVEQEISKMEDDLGKFENAGKNDLENANNSAKLDAKSVEKIKDESGVDEKISGISNRARALFEKTKIAMRNVVIAGMASMAISGSVGNFEKTPDESLEDLKKIELVRESDMDKEEKQLLDEYKKALEEVKLQDQAPARGQVAKIGQELIEHINSQEYLDKLTLECDGDIEKAKDQQERRVGTLKEVFSNGIIFVDEDDLNYEFAKNIQDESDKWAPKWLATRIKLYKKGISGVGGFYKPVDNRATLPNKGDRNSALAARHELLHGSTRASYGILESEKKLLEESYKNLGTSKDVYYSVITERLVRKQQVDFEMEKLGIKKYGEKFTQEHYDKLIEADKSGRLSSDAHQFIMTTKPEYFERIFNEIAADEKNIKDRGDISNVV